MSNGKEHFKVCFCWSRVFKLRGGEVHEDIKEVFESYSTKGIMSMDHLISFLEKEQKEVDVTKKAQNIFNSLRHLNVVHRRGLNLEAFFKYLIGDNNHAHQFKMVKNTFQSMLFTPKSEMDKFPSPKELMRNILISTKPPPKDNPAESDSKFSPHTGHSENGRDTLTQEQVQVEEGDENEDQDEVPKYRDLIAIHAAKHKGGMENFGSHGSSSKVGRLSMNEQALENTVGVIEHSHQLIRFTQRNILRVYPKGTRIKSSNYDPLIAWMRGAQMVAFNMQGYDKYLWMMQGFFRANGGCGYVKKPEFLLRGDGACDEVFNSMALPVKKTLKVKIYMGEGWRADFHFRHFDYCSPPDFYVRVGMAGVPADARKMRKTERVNDQWVPIWNHDDEEFIFPIRVPELALLRIDVKDYDPSGEDEFAGQTCLPLSELRTGIRCVPLYDHRGNVYRSVKLLMRFDFTY
ncbi:phosphoinositide phospholipase C 2 isoform X2 [Capsicum annuum]|uniref:phosphoinositide phospholipase C 2 isoform X2 n=1 Tax=Capsicum annuum TaxID=4072 RepID=UPI001FB16611|nr:phosphoinositide phospholipase C 2 isoform X2 [Capsicum annuum]